MANDLTNYAEGLIGAHLFRTAAWTKPTNLYIALCTAASSVESGTITEISTTATGYARAAVPCADASWTPPSGGNKRYESALAITFPAPTGNWGTITHFAIFDAPTGGNALIVSALTSARAVGSGDAAPVFAAGALRVSFSGSWSDYLVGRVGDHLLRTTPFLKPTTLAVAIFVAGTECAGAGYARVSCNPSDANWTAPSAGNGQFANAAALTFPAPTAPWGTISDVVLYDAATAGNEWCRAGGMSFLMDTTEPTTLPIGALVATIG